MKSRGFTLIELLAVIVILAIIALIATPIVLGIIDDAKAETNTRSASFIVDYVETAYGVAYTKAMGMTPTLAQVAAEFNMKGATWDTATNKITTTDGEVVCEVVSNKTQFSVNCGDFNLATQTMDIYSQENQG